MATKMLEVQQSIFSILEKSKDLSKKINGIFDYVPEKTKTPYITFGETTSDSKDTKTSDGETIKVTIDIWSESRGRKEVVDILIEIESALEEELEVKTGYIISQKVIHRYVDEVQYGLYQGSIDMEVIVGK